MSESNIKLIIFDWGRTLHDPENDSLFPETLDILKKLSSRYTLVLVTLAKSQSKEERLKIIEESGVASYFQSILIGEDEKDDMYETIFNNFGITPKEIAVIDDRAVRGISWGNKKGTMTIWFKNGKFANEFPTAETGEPTQIITDLRELLEIF